MQDKQEIQKYVMKNLSFIIASFAKIENFIITPGETDFLISDFLNNQLPTESQKISLSNFLMVIGIYKVYNLLFLNENPSIERCEFDFQDLQDANGIIARYEDDRCGGIRQCPVISRSIKNYTPPNALNPILIKQEYKNILKEFEKLKKAKTIDIIDFICRTGAFLIKKQLFPNGNNRTMFFSWMLC